MPPQIIFVRCLIGIAVGLFLIAISWIYSYRLVQSLLLSATGIVGLLIAYGAGLGFGATMGGIVVKSYAQGSLAVSIIVESLSIIIPVWMINLTTQFIENGARRLYGLKPHRIELIKRPTVTKSNHTK